LELNPGDRVVVESGGGGGWGPPEERPLEAVAEDLRRGYISPEAARLWYGVRWDPARGAVEEVDADG
jgi:N-methylhydantoinase B